MSGSSYPTLSMTVSLYNILIDHVEDVIGDENEENQKNRTATWLTHDSTRAKFAWML